MYVVSGMKSCASLPAKQARAKWESVFHTVYIQQLMVVSAGVHFNTAVRKIQIVLFEVLLSTANLTIITCSNLKRGLKKPLHLSWKIAVKVDSFWFVDCWCVFLANVCMYSHFLQIPEQDRLLYTVFEKNSVAESSIAPHLWTYRSRITLEHLFQTLQAQDKRKECPILYQFLTQVRLVCLTSISELGMMFLSNQEPTLRATQYLPGIVQLQQQMYDNFHHKLDRKEANQYTIKKFIKLLGRSEFAAKQGCCCKSYCILISF